MLKKTDSLVKLFSYADDQPREGKGMLIPGEKAPHPKHTFTPASARSNSAQFGGRIVVTAVAVFAMAVISIAGYGVVAQTNLASAPAVMIVDSHTQNSTNLDYGPQPALANDGFFTDTRDAFIDQGLTFIEVDVPELMLRYFKKGVLYQSTEILGVGEAGSWWDVPSGLYKIEKKDENIFTNISQVYLPWQLTFQGNFVIHGWPSYSDGAPVTADFIGGGVRLTDEAAQLLYKEARISVPILVHADTKKRDTFVYEPKVPDIHAPNYFIADIDNGTVLAATDLDVVVPIASLTKLMTAVVASENIDLNNRVQVTSPTFVTTLIPRLSERSSVSMYSLLQLLLVESSNEAAETIAGEIGRDKFVETMNAKARQLGMMHTTFADPSGLSSDNVSSLGDLYRLTKYIHDNRSFIFEITANKKVPNAYVGGEFEELVNFNEVKDIDSFVGGKVGETLAAGQTSISLHNLTLQKTDRTVVVILLGSDSRTEDVTALVDYVEQKFAH